MPRLAGAGEVGDRRASSPRDGRGEVWAEGLTHKSEKVYNGYGRRGSRDLACNKDVLFLGATAPARLYPKGVVA
jgi:hypothetical protein